MDEWAGVYGLAAAYGTPRAGPAQLVAESSALAVPLDEAKLHLRVETSEDDPVVRQAVLAARRFVERRVSGHRRYLSTTYDLPVSGWWDRLELPYPPLASVASVKYRDGDGAEQTADAALYLAHRPEALPGYLTRAPDASWPTLQADRAWPVTVRFVAGYAAAESLPADVRQALLYAVTLFYERREPAKADLGLVDALLAGDAYGSY